MDNDFIIIEKSNIPYTTTSTTTTSRKLMYKSLKIIRFLWRHPYLVYNGVPLIILVIYLYPIVYNYYKSIGMVYAVYTSAHHTYSKYKQAVSFCHQCHSYISTLYD